jgi:phenylacetate-coenzyme A ligase PaaK-like adenylate-forming protein
MIKKDLFLDLLSYLPGGIAYIPFKKIMLGEIFRDWTRTIEKVSGYGKEAILEYHFSSFRNLVEKAYDLTEFYRQKYDKAGFSPDQLKEIKDIKKVPYLTRKEIQEHAGSMILKNSGLKCLYRVFTSGTGSTPLSLYADIDSRIREWASLCYVWKKTGYKPGDARVEFRGKIRKEKFCQWRPELRALRVNIRAINDANVEFLNKQINKREIKYFNGYPWSIYRYAMELKRKGIYPIKNIMGIMTSGGTIYAWQVNLMKEVFPEADILSFYGMSEKAALGMIDLTNNSCNFLPAYSLVERDNEGFLVGTSFVNTVMPLIRYRTDDLIGALKLDKGTDSFEQYFPVTDNYIGRKNEQLWDDKERLVSKAAIERVFAEHDDIKMSKIIQGSSGELEIIIEPIDIVYSKEVQRWEGLRRNLRNILGENARINIEFTENMPYGDKTKYQWIESNIKRE